MLCDLYFNVHICSSMRLAVIYLGRRMGEFHHAAHTFIDEIQTTGDVPGLC